MTLTELIRQKVKDTQITFKGEKEPRNISDIAEFVIKQAGLYRFDKATNKVVCDFDENDLKYIAMFINRYQYNPFIGEVSFFKSKNGKVQAMPYYGAKLERLFDKLKANKWDGKYKYEVRKDDAMGIYGHLEINGDTYDLALNDYPQYKGPLQFIKLRKQTFLQYIKEKHHDIDGGLDIDEVRAFNLDYQSKLEEQEQEEPKKIENVEVVL